jgi:hypothetical protein
MSEAFMILPNFRHIPEQQVVLEQEAVIPAKPDDVTANPEAYQAVDSVFSQDQDKLSTLSMMGFWSAAMLLGDMARDHQQRAAEEEDRSEEEEEEQPHLPPA